jgi:hypothetical protein
MPGPGPQFPCSGEIAAHLSLRPGTFYDERHVTNIVATAAVITAVLSQPNTDTGCPSGSPLPSVVAINMACERPQRHGVRRTPLGRVRGHNSPDGGTHNRNGADMVCELPQPHWVRRIPPGKHR